MQPRANRYFMPVANGSPAFNSTSLSTATSYRLESDVLMRNWSGPSNRSVRIANTDLSAPYYVHFGSSDVVANTNTSCLVPGKRVYVFHIPPSITHVSFVSSTSVVVNVGIGYGGLEEDGGGGASRNPTVVVATSTGFTIQQAGSVTFVNWLDPAATWTKGDAFHVEHGYHYSTST